MILKKCPKCKTYNLTEKCRKCKTTAEPVHYKFLGLKDAPPTFKRK